MSMDAVVEIEGKKICRSRVSVPRRAFDVHGRKKKRTMPPQKKGFSAPKSIRCPWTAIKVEKDRPDIQLSFSAPKSISMSMDPAEYIVSASGVFGEFQCPEEHSMSMDIVNMYLLVYVVEKVVSVPRRAFDVHGRLIQCWIGTASKPVSVPRRAFDVHGTISSRPKIPAKRDMGFSAPKSIRCPWTTVVT